MSDPDDFEDLLDVIGGAPATKSTESGPVKNTDEPTSATDLKKEPADKHEGSVSSEKPTITKRKMFKVEKDIDWGDDNPTDLLLDQSVKKATVESDITIDGLLGTGGSDSKRPPTGERRLDSKPQKPLLKVTQEDDMESLSGRGYQPSLSSRGTRKGKADFQSTQGSVVKFGGESILETESVLSGRKAPSLLKGKGSESVLDILAGDNKSSSISDWLKEDERPEATNDWMNLAKSRQTNVEQERPKTSSSLSAKAPERIDLRPSTSPNEPLFGDEIPLDQLLGPKTPSTGKIKQIEHYQTPQEKMKDLPFNGLSSEAKTLPSREKGSNDDLLSLMSGPSVKSRDSAMEPSSDVKRVVESNVDHAYSVAANSEVSKQPTSTRRKSISQTLSNLFDDSATRRETSPVKRPAEVNTSVTEVTTMFNEEKELLVKKYENKLKHLNELHEDEMKRSKEEKEAIEKHFKSIMELMEKDRVDLIARHDRNLQEAELRHQTALENLRLLSERNFSEAKMEFERKVEGVKKQKEMEIEAIRSASSHLQSVNVVVEQLESQARTINEISCNLGNKTSSTLDAREFQIRAKENEIKIQEDRLERQLYDTERERRKIQELIAKMEVHMRDTASSLENDKFTLMQDQARVAAEKKNLHLQQEEQLNKIAQERSWLDKAKSDFEKEQKEERSQLYEERRLLGIERAKLEASMKSYSEREKHESLKNAQVEADISGSLKAIAQEHEVLAKTSAQLKVDRDKLEQEKALLDESKRKFEIERKTLDESMMENKHRYLQLENLAADASKIREEGLQALNKATGIELEEKHRLQQIKEKLASLRAQEQSLAQERLLLAQQHRSLEAKKDTLVCSKCSGPVKSPILPTFSMEQPLDLNVAPSMPDLARSTTGAAKERTMVTVTSSLGAMNDSGFNTPADFTSQINNALSVEQMRKALQLEYDLEYLRSSAQSDDQILQDEQDYLNSLRASQDLTSTSIW